MVLACSSQFAVHRKILGVPMTLPALSNAGSPFTTNTPNSELFIFVYRHPPLPSLLCRGAQEVISASLSQQECHESSPSFTASADLHEAGHSSVPAQLDCLECATALLQA